MQETYATRQREPERTRDASAPKPTQRKESIQRSSEPQRRSLYEQIVGNRVPPHLRLSASPQTSDEQPAPRLVEENVPQGGELLAPVSGEEQSPVQRREALRAQLWGSGVPPHLRLSPPSEPVQLKENTTGLPDRLKEGVEDLSGIALDDVRVQYDSSKPAEVQALAYTQGTGIHIGPGQEQYLAHEAWHVVQQKQGRVKSTVQAKGMEINDDEGLEQEADVMGMRAQGIQDWDLQNTKSGCRAQVASHGQPVVQRMLAQEEQVDFIAWVMDRLDNQVGETEEGIEFSTLDQIQRVNLIGEAITITGNQLINTIQEARAAWLKELDRVMYNHTAPAV